MLKWHVKNYNSWSQKCCSQTLAQNVMEVLSMSPKTILKSWKSPWKTTSIEDTLNSWIILLELIFTPVQMVKQLKSDQASLFPPA